MDEAKGGNHLVTVDLESQTVTSPSGAKFHFDIDPQRKAKMLKGLDAIGETLQAAEAIDLYEMKRALAQPWLEDA
jgi:3-isopropylmalate dehydratase/3-isopropylmalate/(R)-2-methylmalate dehydratase small subunit